MAKTIIFVVEDGEEKYKIHIRYGKDSNFSIRPEFVESRRIDFNLFIYVHEKRYMLVDIGKLRQNDEYEKCKNARKRFLLANFNKVKKFEVEDEKIKETLKPCCEAAFGYDSQDSFRNDPRIEETEDDEYVFIK